PPRQPHLLGDLGGRPALLLAGHPAGDVARPEVPPLAVLAGPPRQQPRVALLLLADRPVQLRAEVIGPGLAQPEPGVGVQLGVLVEAGDARRVARPPDAERADAHLHPRLGRLHPAVWPAHEAVDRRTPPIAPARPASPLAVLLPGAVVGEGDRLAVLAFFLIGVEIVVDVDAIDVVAADHVEHDGQGVVLDVLARRVEPVVAA